MMNKKTPSKDNISTAKKGKSYKSFKKGSIPGLGQSDNPYGSAAGDPTTVRGR